MKAKNLRVTREFLTARAERVESLGYTKQKWVMFCEHLLDHGFELSLYEAKHTVSKYVTVRRDGKEFLVRFSNHRPNKGKEISNDCDFFVGVTHTGVRTTGDALRAVMKFFGSSNQLDETRHDN